MKKILICLLTLFILVGCDLKKDETSESKNEKYFDYCDLLSHRATFNSKSELFNISSELSKIDTGGYRYFIVIDDAKTAMYNIEAIALVKDSDYKTNMAANIGIFEDKKYSIIPNQVNVADDFVKGVTISGLTDQSDCVIYLLVQWTNKDMTITNREFVSIYLTEGVPNE